MKKTSLNLSREFKGKNILITGGTGSIGMGIAKQLVKYDPKEIRIFSNDENSIFEAKENLGGNNIYKFMVGDVRDKDRLNLAIRSVDIVYHAAAILIPIEPVPPVIRIFFPLNSLDKFKLVFFIFV